MSGPTERSHDEEQRLYARWLEIGSRVGLAVLVVSFAAYAAGWPAPFVPVERLPELWSLPVGRYLQASGMPTGWGWLSRAWQSDLAGLAGIAILAGCSLPALLALAWHQRAEGDRVYAGLSGAVALVLVLAASGWLTGGH